MRNLFGNNCSKGCLIYVLALVAVLALTSMGVGSLGSRFGAGSNVQISPLNVPPSQSSNPVAPDNLASTQANSQQAQPAQPVVPTPTNVPITIQIQPGTINGEASQPFYIVEPGDTLWGIAQDYGITVDTLKAVNNAADEIIKPGELVYLPQEGQVQVQPQPQSQPQPQQEPAAPAQPATDNNQQPGGNLPTMPQTGINKTP